MWGALAWEGNSREENERNIGAIKEWGENKKDR